MVTQDLLLTQQGIKNDTPQNREEGGGNQNSGSMLERVLLELVRELVLVLEC